MCLKRHKTALPFKKTVYNFSLMTLPPPKQAFRAGLPPFYLWVPLF